MKQIMYISIFVILNCILAQAKDFYVSNIIEINQAVKQVAPGDSIILADGIYLGNIKLENVNGTANKPITLRGSKDSIIDGGNFTTGCGLYMNNSNYWIIQGFSITNSLQAIKLEFSCHNIMQDMNLYYFGQEAVHIRRNSTDNTFKNSTISYTGRKDDGRGEGVYIGLACIYWLGHPDRSDRNRVLYNRFGPYVTAECVDIKEATSDNLIQGNYFDGTGMSGHHAADSWVDVKGHNNTISNNFGIFSVKDGFQVHDQRHFMINDMAVWVHMFPSGCGNVFKDNICSNLTAKGGQCTQFKSVTACSNEDINNATI